MLTPSKFDFEFNDLKFDPNYHFNFGFKENTKNLILVHSFSSVDRIYDSLMGFSDHTSGFIRFDGILIDDLNIAQIRNDIQIIRQDQFFIGTIWENLVGLKPEHHFSLTQVHEVLERLGLLENILSLPDQLNTVIQPKGFPLSRSQLLTLQIAKSILLKPKILFVTPDFEQISTFKRKLVYKELLSKENQWTLLFFTQRLYRGEFDRFCVLERSLLKDLKDERELLKEIENHGA
jgi:ABC-type multidrug transport system fused ATPase/permease subunit